MSPRPWVLVRPLSASVAQLTRRVSTGTIADSVTWSLSP